MVSRNRLQITVLATLWMAATVGPPLGLWWARDGWLEALARPDAQVDWDEFRRGMAKQTGREGPVQRKVPRSVEPPSRVWLRDYFGLAVGAWVTFAGVLGALVALLFVGATRQASGSRHGGDDRGRQRHPGSLSKDEFRRHGDGDEQHQHDEQDAEQRKHRNGPRGGATDRQTTDGS
jgi:hypothetical protein